jgi:hypothetical protein
MNYKTYQLRSVSAAKYINNEKFWHLSLSVNKRIVLCVFVGKHSSPRIVLRKIVTPEPKYRTTITPESCF